MDELLRKSPAQTNNHLSAHLNVILEIDNVDTSKQENQINLFKENSEVKPIYEEAVNQTTTNSNTLKKFKVLTRQGKEGDFPVGPTEPVKSSLPNKPSEPKKIPEFNVFPDSIFPIKPLSFSEIMIGNMMPIKRNWLNMSPIEIESTTKNHKSIFPLKSRAMIFYIGWEQMESKQL